jgi:hypothetical protein
VRDLQAAHLVEAKRAQHLPVRDRHTRRIGAQFLSYRAQRPLTGAKAWQFAPTSLLDRRD